MAVGVEVPPPATRMMRRRAMTAGVTATAGLVAAAAAGQPIAAVAVIVGYVLVGGGRAGWRRPRWYEPLMSASLACLATVWFLEPWWQIGFLALAVLECLRLVVLAYSIEAM